MNATALTRRELFMIDKKRRFAEFGNALSVMSFLDFMISAFAIDFKGTKEANPFRAPFFDSGLLGGFFIVFSSVFLLNSYFYFIEKYKPSELNKSFWLFFIIFIFIFINNIRWLL